MMAQFGIGSRIRCVALRQNSFCVIFGPYHAHLFMRILIVCRDRSFVGTMVNMKKYRTALGKGLSLAVAGVAIVLGMATGGCSIPVADLPVIGLPAGAPPRPADPGPYPAVNDLPAGRAAPMLDPTEQAKIESDLKAARSRQAGTVGTSSPKTANHSSDD
jgi:hypothetical protein